MKIRHLIIFSLALLLNSLVCMAAADAPEPKQCKPGFLVLASDRGFLGNEEIRDAVADLEKTAAVELVFITDERTRGSLQSAVKRLESAGVSRVVLLPLFLSTAETRYQMVLEMLEQCPSKNPKNWLRAVKTETQIEGGKAFGQSVFAVEILAERLRHIQDATGKQLLVVGYGSTDSDSRRRIQADLQRLVHNAVVGTGFAQPRVMVWQDWTTPDREQWEGTLTQELKEAVGSKPTIVVPFHLGRKLDSMMAFNTQLSRILRDTGAQMVDSDVTPHPHVATWLLREANKFKSINPEDVGVVFLAHGSDFHWNETMREAAAPLTEQYKVEFAFSMADPPTIERAVRRLEKRGARAIIVLRVFGMALSFKSTVDQVLGLDVEHHKAHTEKGEALARPGSASYSPVARSSSGGHGHASTGARIVTSALLTTVGGLEDHPLFAAGLLERAKELSKDPKTETIILTAHGSGSDEINEQWRRILRSLASQIRTLGGDQFRDIKLVTWREDWPDKRGTEIEAARQMVSDATRDNGRAIVIPARTTLSGPENKFLEGLEFEVGRGFAPHSLFVDWMENQIEEGLSHFRRAAPAVAACCVARFAKE